MHAWYDCVWSIEVNSNGIGKVRKNMSAIGSHLDYDAHMWGFMADINVASAGSEAGLGDEGLEARS